MKFKAREATDGKMIVGFAGLGAVLGTGMFFTSSAKAADAHTTWYCDAVKGGHAIVWEDTTSYDAETNVGISNWNRHNTINIYHDPGWFDSTSLEFGNMSESGGTYARYQCWIAKASTIKYNTQTFPNVSTGSRNKIATHELGHALDLDHNSIAGDVMKTGAFSIGSCLGAHTNSDYHSRWGNGSSHTTGCK